MRSLLYLLLFSTILFARPTAPSNLVLEALSTTKVSISWRDNSENERSFKIFRDNRLIATLPPNSQSYTDSGLEPNHLYTYTIKASDDRSKSRDYEKWDGGIGVIHRDPALSIDIELGGERVHKIIHCYYPSNINTSDKRSPVILFGGSRVDDNSYKNYIELFKVMASHGYTVYFITHSYSKRLAYIGEEFYKSAKAVLENPEDSPYLDTSKVGLMGLSSGAGALIYAGYRLFKEDGYGTRGKFIFQLSPNIAHNIEDGMLKNFPKNTFLLTQIYDHSLPDIEGKPNYYNESANDPRTFIDIFNNISIPIANKEFIIVRGAKGSGLKATHFTPLSQTDQLVDDLDRYAIFRPFLALADKAFYDEDIGYYNSLERGVDEVNNNVVINYSSNPQELFESVFGGIKSSDSYPYNCKDHGIYAREQECLNALK